MFSLRNVSFLYSAAGDDAGTARIERQGIEVESLDIATSGVTAVIGSSGSGKTTLLSILAGFLQPTIGPNGHLHFDGQPFGQGGHPPGRVSFIFQSSMLLGAANGLVNVLQGQVAAARPSRNYPAHCTEPRWLLNQLGLVTANKSVIAKRARNLSGGEAQRMAIVRALLTDPDVVLCDEPTSSLDDRNAEQVLQTLRIWSQERNRPVVWVTHDINRAARYADHFVFVSKARVVEVDQEKLGRASGDNKVAILRSIARQLQLDGPHPDGDGDNQSDTDGEALQPIQVTRGRYAAWLANSLSTDGLFTDSIENGKDSGLAPDRLQKLIQRVDPRFKVPFGTVGRFALQIVNYSQLNLALVLFVLAAQIFAAFLLGDIADLYSRKRLQDPSVARMVFEHVVGVGSGNSAEPMVLYVEPTLNDIAETIRNRLMQSGQHEELDRVLVYGRRSIPNSSLRFPDANPACSRWQPVETIALNAADPLVRQMVLVKDDPTLVGSVDAVLDVVRQAAGIATPNSFTGRPADAASAEGPRRLAFVNESLVRVLRTKCGLAPGSTLLAEWAAGPAGTLQPVRIEIAGAIEQPPPLYPNAADLIVFEHDYQYAVNLSKGGEPDPFRIATAYFPIEGFDIARSVIEERGYRIRDDSAAAVETLRKVSAAAKGFPPYVIILNLLGCTLIVTLAILSIAELNKKFLAIFIAHGLRFRDMSIVFIFHIFPALVISSVFLIAIILVVWSGISDVLPEEIGPVTPVRDQAMTTSVGLIFVVTFLVSTFVALVLWRQIKSRLGAYLQE